MGRFRALALTAGVIGSFTQPAVVQAQEVVQRLPDAATNELTQALQRLGRNPSSVPALLRAGRASLSLDDTDAALSFFSRAQAVAPGNGEVLAGLALVALRRGDPARALELFTNADAAGHRLDAYAAHQGLAFDLVGRNDDAQRLYRQSLAQAPNAVVTRRLALSYAIAGDANLAESTLLPLLQQSDAAAFRTRAFMLSILGRSDEALSIANAMLPARISSQLAPYLRAMPQLTRAQQAAAAHLGRFPDSADIGQDNEGIARAGVAAFANTQESGAERIDARLIPTGEALGQAARAKDGDPPASTRQEEPQTQEQPPSLAEAFSSFIRESRDDADGPGIPEAQGAVDITSFEPARESQAQSGSPPSSQAEAPAPSPHPARHWVQVATGQNAAAFRFDWRRLVRLSEGLLDDESAFRASWNSTNRLVTGPFATADDAQELVTALANTGIGAFRWTSEEGEEVMAIQ